MPASGNKQVLILGGGLIGLSVAYELARQGKAVEVLSRNRNEAAGFVAAGMLAPHAEGLSQNLLKLSEVSLELIPKWVAQIETDSGIRCGLRQCGIVVPFLDSDKRDQYPTAALGESMNRSELIQEIPGISPEWETGLIFNQDGQIDNRRQLMRALEKACVGLGVKFQEGVKVLKLIAKNKNFEGVQIQTAEGIVKDLIGNEGVLCSGAWSNQLLQEIPIFPVKGQMLSIQGPKDALKRIIFGPGTYLVPREDGLIVVGATSEPNAVFREGLTPSGQRQLNEGICSLLPIASQWPRMERWWGFRPCTPDKNPVLGDSPLKGLWIASGHYRNGVLLAAITAELIGKSICKKPLSKSEKELLSHFNWNRFKNESPPVKTI